MNRSIRLIEAIKKLQKLPFDDTDEMRDTFRKMTTKHISDNGDSLDKDGKLTLYHGTPNHKAIEKSGHFHAGTFFSTNPEHVKSRYMGQHASKKGKWKLLKTKADPADILASGQGSNVYTARTHNLKPHTD